MFDKTGSLVNKQMREYRAWGWCGIENPSSFPRAFSGNPVICIRAPGSPIKALGDDAGTLFEQGFWLYSKFNAKLLSAAAMLTLTQ